MLTSSGGEYNLWDSFSRGFNGSFSGFKTLFTDPLSLIRPLSFSEAFQETLGLLMPGTKITFAQLRANTVLSSGDVDGYAEIQGGLFGDAVLDGLSLVPVGRLAKFAKIGRAARGGGNLWKVGSYKSLRGLEAGLDAHHVGQKALMKRLVPKYNANTAPSILVPKAGHTIGSGVVSRSTSGLSSARQVLARDIFELRRVYGSQGIPNSSLQQLIRMNRKMYPGAFIK